MTDDALERARQLSRVGDDEAARQAYMAVLRDDPSPLQAPAEFQRIVRRCLAKQPKDRFPSVGELSVALEQISLKPFDQMDLDEKSQTVTVGVGDRKSVV